ncbi:DNA-binding protein [Gordoniibacillus kamchatkensis]|uniref:RNA-binding protein KhpB n=1 Tax=Gordoniibacillus kamchatkensis TaxID=1590651 RepID=A0ABR5AEY9_9BACL|nr:RNA-binding cell elongation regulator Jag/EloR [Paenibacillus sp. VKM B-2647]KIL39626.1 DNA-binding protein [Paenibacillus sp. VKM B-2647]
MNKVVVTGKSIQDAVKAGLQQLGATEDRVRMTVIEQPVKGLFGLFGAKDAKVELELIPDPLEEAASFLRSMLDTMNVPASLDIVRNKEGADFQLSGPELGIVIGKRGQTLDAIQYLTNIVANRYSDSHVKIVIDAEQFRDRRRKTLEELAYRLASRVVKTRKEVILEPMTASERKIIHSELQNHPRVKTYSKGDEPNRRVVITLK